MKNSWIPLLGHVKLTQNVLWEQEEQEMAIKKCRKKVDCMTDEMKMFQRITTEDAMLKQVNNRLNPANLYT